MTFDSQANQMSHEEIVALLKAHQELQRSHDELLRQVEWFKRELFGSRSERRMLDPSGRQLTLGEWFHQHQTVQSVIEVPSHERRRPGPERPGDEPVRFDPSVPVEEIEVPNPELEGQDLSDYSLVDTKVTERLAQRPGSYVVLRYLRKVYKRKSDGAFSCPAAPPSVLEKSCADVSLLAGLVIDKIAYHLPLYRQHQRVVHAQCWSHARRQFMKAEQAEPDRVLAALTIIGEIYERERAVRENGLSPEDALAFRAEHVRPSVDRFFAHLRKVRSEEVLLPTNLFAKAADYCLAREPALRVFLEYPDVPLDTNHLERAIRPIAVGRKNWLFCWTEIGAKYVGILQSLLSTCRVQGVDPYTYFVDVLQRIDRHPARDVAQLTPRLWKEHFAASPFRSDIDRAMEARGPDSVR